jgi:dTDP-4-dehydrorhamnose reductase
VVVTGAAGQLGSFIVDTFQDRPVVALTRDRLDVTDHGAVQRTLRDLAPSVIVNCAAFNDVDGAEDAPVAALAGNAFAVRNLARASAACAATLVHYSTDFVFDGRTQTAYDEQSAPSPQSTYAASKLLGEWFAQHAPRAFVLRVESLFGCPPAWQGRRGTLDTIVMKLRQGIEQPVFVDRIVTPSYLGDVAAATRFLVESGAPAGLYHCVNTGQASWSQVAVAAAAILGVAPRLKPISVDEVTFRASRPRFCALSNRKLAAAGFEMPTWQDALRRWLAAERQHPRKDQLQA